MEHGPHTTSRRGSRPEIISEMVLRDWAICASCSAAQRKFSFQLLRGHQNLFVGNMYVVQRVFCMMVILFSSFAIVDPQRGGNNDTTTGKDFNPQSVNFNLHDVILWQ